MAVSRSMILAAASIRIRHLFDPDSPIDSPPITALLAEDGTPLRNEDGSYSLTEE